MVTELGSWLNLTAISLAHSRFISNHCLHALASAPAVFTHSSMSRSAARNTRNALIHSPRGPCSVSTPAGSRADSLTGSASSAVTSTTDAPALAVAIASCATLSSPTIINIPPLTFSFCKSSPFPQKMQGAAYRQGERRACQLSAQFPFLLRAPAAAVQSQIANRKSKIPGLNFSRLSARTTTRPLLETRSGSRPGEPEIRKSRRS